MNPSLTPPRRSLNVLLVPVGSHGDVHPLVGVGMALRRRGHRVTVLTSPYFEEMIRRAGLAFLPVGTCEQYLRGVRDPDLWNGHKAFNVVARMIMENVRAMHAEVVAACEREPEDTVVVGSSLALAARVAQETHGVPLATVHLQPSMFPSLHDTPRYPGMPLPRWYPRFLKRWILHGLAYRGVIDWVLGRPLNAWRAELGLPRAKGILLDWMNSPRLVIGLFPEWFGQPQPDWPAQARLTGFPLYDEREQQALSPELERFLEEGDAPIAFTPGSAMAQGHAFFAASADACRLIGRRGILLSRHKDHIPQTLPPGVIHVDYAPFSQLLPRCAALVYHGGVGTAAQALAAGVPQLVMPLAHDQFDTAERIRRLGVGRSVPVKRYKAPRVAIALADLLDLSRVRERCRAVAAKFEGVDALGETCELIEGLAPSAADGNGHTGAGLPRASGSA